MIKHTVYCDRCGTEIQCKDDNTLASAILSLAEQLRLFSTKRKLDFYVGIHEGPELDFCNNCRDELANFMNAGRKDKET